MTRISHYRMGTVLALCPSVAACWGQVVLAAHSPPATTDLTAPCALFFDVEALREPVVIERLTTGVYADAGEVFRFELLIRDGTSLGGSATTGPGSSLTGWTSLGIVTGAQGSIGGGVSQQVELPRFVVRPGQVTGVALWFHEAWGVRFFRDLSSPYMVYSDTNVRLTTGDGRSPVFVSGQLYFPKCTLIGSLTYEIAPCYPNCDSSTIAPVLNVNDFVCFMTKFANGDTYANCDGSTTPPVLNVNDFVCFATSFAQGCS